MIWLKLSPEQEAQLASISAGNPGPHFLTPVHDVNGDAWLSGSARTDLETFAIYEEFLAQDFVTSPTPPILPESEA